MKRVILCILVNLPALHPIFANPLVTVNVTVQAPPPCTVNDEKPIEIEFHELLTTRIDGVRYRTPLNYTLSCDGAANNAMKIQLVGSSASFDNSLLQTSTPGLGIMLQRGEEQIPINNWVNFTYPEKPDLWAIPIKQKGATLTGGEFTAGALMKIDFQ